MNRMFRPRGDLTGQTAKTYSEKMTFELCKGLYHRDFGKAERIINSGTHIHEDFIFKHQTLEELAIDCGNASIARLVLEEAEIQYKIAKGNSSFGNGNRFLYKAISQNSPEMVSLCLELGATPGLSEFESAMRAHPSILTLLSKFAAVVIKTTDWQSATPPSNKLVDYFLGRKFFVPEWLKGAHKCSKETILVMLTFAPNSHLLGPIVDDMLREMIRSGEIERLQIIVQKWGLKLSQMQHNPALYAISLPMLTYLKDQGCFDVKLAHNRNLLHETINIKSLWNKELFCYMIQLGVDPFEQDDQGNTPLHFASKKQYLYSEYIEKITNRFKDVRFYTLLNSSQESVSTVFDPQNPDLVELYSFYEQVVNSPDSQQKSWIETFREHMLKFCKKKFFAISRNSSMENFIAHIALFDFELVKPILMKNGLLILNQDLGKGYTLLMKYVKKKSLDLCKELVQWGANPFVITNEQTTIFKSIHSVDKLHYFLSLGVRPTRKDIYHMDSEMRMKLFDHPNTHQIIIQICERDPILRMNFLSTFIKEEHFKPSTIHIIEDWLKESSSDEQKELFHESCQLGNVQITRFLLNIIPADVLCDCEIISISNEHILALLLQEGIPFKINRLQKQLVVPLLRFKLHYILRLVHKLDEEIFVQFLTILKQGNYSHLPYNFMEKKVLFHRDVIIITYDSNTRQQQQCSINDGAMQHQIKDGGKRDEVNKCRSMRSIMREIERTRFESERAPAMPTLVSSLQVILHDMQEASRSLQQNSRPRLVLCPRNPVQQ